MSLDKRSLAVYKDSKLVSTHTNPMSFGKNLRMINRVYNSSDRDTQAFLRKMLLMRMNESRAMVQSRQYTPGEKSIIKSNRIALEDVWERWKQNTAGYEP
jgi:hypothetical protein